jgi:hypothetical protein
LVSDIKGEQRLRGFEKRGPKEMFGPRRDEVTGGCRKPPNDYLHNLYSSPSIIRMVTSRRTKRNTYRILVEKPEGKGLLGRPIHRWVDNIKMHIVEIGWDGMGWIGLAQDRDQWRALH